MAEKPPKAKYEIVMLVDDNDIDNFINERMIRGCNFSETIYINSSTRSAIEFLKNLSINKNLRKGHLPSIVFLDINMPILDGFQFIEEFEKLDPSLVEAIRIVMLTSSINPSDIEESKKYKSVTGFIHKPLTEEALAAL
ncbi:MAG TPA: response regulator [Bacteroidia bacterium]|nr:response regulator [Bacteroidia bacterium]